MAKQFNLLLVDDDPTVIAVLRRMLVGLGQLRFATSGQDALRLAREKIPDLVLLDIEMPGMSGFEVCAAMKEDAALREVPVIFVSSHDSEEQEVLGLTLGAVDFISKPPRQALVLARVKTHLRVKQMADALRRAASTDALTGIANRREFDEVLAREWARAERVDAPLGLLLVDIDFFKAYNDHYGHQAGDSCLKIATHTMQQVAQRPSDLLARYGGEEFALLLPDTDAAGADALALQLLQAFEALHLPHAASSVSPYLSVSVGATAFDSTCMHWGESSRSPQPLPYRSSHYTADLVAAADQALYAAKQSGRRQARFLSIDNVGKPQLANAIGPNPNAAQEPAPDA